MELVEKSNSLQFHYFFNDESHSFKSILRNECEKEILYVFLDIAETLGLQLELETLPTEEGGFKEFWKFLGKNSSQITILVSIAAIIISRFPVENEELNKLQIENLKLDNELKRKELDKLKLDTLEENSEISQKVIVDCVELVNRNYKVSWRKSNFYKKINSYLKIDSIEILRFDDKLPVGLPRNISKREFSNFILNSDNLPQLDLDSATIDVISPAIKRGKFKWKGFYNNEIINFTMNDSEFLSKVLKGDIHFSNRYSIEVEMTQERKINQDGNVAITNTVVHRVIASIESENRIEF